MAWAAISPYLSIAVVKHLKKFERPTTEARCCNTMLNPGLGDAPPGRQEHPLRPTRHLVRPGWCSGCCYSLRSSNRKPASMDSSPGLTVHELQAVAIRQRWLSCAAAPLHTRLVHYAHGTPAGAPAIAHHLCCSLKGYRVPGPC